MRGSAAHTAAAVLPFFMGKGKRSLLLEQPALIYRHWKWKCGWYDTERERGGEMEGGRKELELLIHQEFCF